jgi:hypothetical protein
MLDGIGERCQDIMTHLSVPHIPYVSDAEEKAAIADVLKHNVIAICNQYDGMMIGSFSHMNDNIRFELNEIVECVCPYSLLRRSEIERLVYDLWNTYC